MIKHEDLGINADDIRDEYDRETLLGWKQVIDEDIMRIGLQIDEAKAKKQATGEYADPNWFHKARTAKKMYGMLSQQIQRQLSKVKERDRKEFNEQFIDVCYRELDSDLIKELKSKARAEIQNDMHDYIGQNYL